MAVLQQRLGFLMRYLLAKISFIFSLCFLSLPALASDDRDPWEGWNRNVHAFNEVMDTYVARPVAIGYRFISPRFVRTGISNFFSNLGEVPTVVNDLLQAKPGDALRSSGRFVINSTVGVFGLIDVASWLDIEEHSEDLGQTLAVWGVGSGPYVVIPFLGPSTLRDSLSIYPNYQLSLIRYAPLTEEETYGVLALDLVHRRESLLNKESLISGDKYVFYRDAYLQSRNYEIKDGEVEDSFDAGFDDFDSTDFDDDF
ncbi:phospholipid-binding lipoprotein MlaA [Oceanospirillum linum]|nr:phospholipid-binding lipoprotein MlaA [Oleiphilus messinensis]SMP30841.1 phospholipid-binding lipoprotein MlaA [Oceanospirillum linum]